MNTNDFASNESVVKPVTDLFKLLSKSKPIYTLAWIEYQIENITEKTTLIELVELFQNASITFNQKMTRKQRIKADRLMIKLSFTLAIRVYSIKD